MTYYALFCLVIFKLFHPLFLFQPLYFLPIHIYCVKCLFIDFKIFLPHLVMIHCFKTATFAIPLL
jgi:hypothetical protein